MRLTKKHIALVGLALSLFMGWWAVETTEASIDYWLENRETFTKGLNSVTIYCKNGGGADGKFRLRLTFVNASFSNQTKKPYIQVDNSTVKIPFLLHKGESNQKRVYFTTNENVDEFSMKLSCIKISLFLKSNPRYPRELRYEWNEEARNFCCID